MILPLLPLVVPSQSLPKHGSKPLEYPFSNKLFQGELNRETTQMKTMLKNLGAPFQLFALLTVKSAYFPIFCLCSGIKLVINSNVVSNPAPPIRML